MKPLLKITVQMFTHCELLTFICRQKNESLKITCCLRLPAGGGGRSLGPVVLASVTAPGLPFPRRGQWEGSFLPHPA